MHCSSYLITCDSRKEGILLSYWMPVSRGGREHSTSASLRQHWQVLWPRGGLGLSQRMQSEDGSCRRLSE